MRRKRLRQALARLWRSFWLPGRRDREVHAMLGAERELEEEGKRRDKARARFWAELREGQREAEANSSRARS